MNGVVVISTSRRRRSLHELPTYRGRRSTSYSDYRSTGSIDRPPYTPVYSDLSPRFRQHYDTRLQEYPRRAENYFSYPGITPTHSSDGRIMSKYTRPYDRSYDITTTKHYESSRLNERALARPADHDAPTERPRPPPDSGEMRSSHPSDQPGNMEDRALFHALKNRYQESAERSTNDPGARTPFSTWRRSGNFEDVVSPKGHDNGRDNVPSTPEKSDSLKRNSRYNDATNVKGQSESMSVVPKEQVDQNPDDLIYNFRKALHRHRFSENEKNDSNRLSGVLPDSPRVAMEEESVSEKLERLKAAKARIEERKKSEQVKSASFATEFKVEPNVTELEKSDKEKDAHDCKITEQPSTKSTKLSRQKLVSDDLKAKYMESKKEEREKTPEQSSFDKADSLSKKRTSRKSKHKEHMEYWSKDDSKPKAEKDIVPSAEEMLLGATNEAEKSSSLHKKSDTSGSPFQFCSDYSSKPSKQSQDNSKPSVSPSLLRKHVEVTKTVSDNSERILKDTLKDQQQSEPSEAAKMDKTRKYKKYAKAKSHELGALSSGVKTEQPKPETKDDSAVSPGLDELSRLERIAKYKEERRKQLATISSKFSNEGNKELPSLFLAGTSAQDSDSSLGRSKSLKVESERRSPSPHNSVSRSKSLKQDRNIELHEVDDSSPVVVSKISGLKLAEIGSGQNKENSEILEPQYNTDNIIDKLQALRKLREEHLKKSGMTVEELKSKRSSREEQDYDKSSRGSSVESFGMSRTLLADRVFEGKEKQDRTPSRERVRSNSREKNAEARHSFKARERNSIPESESDRATDMSDADSDIHVRVKPRKTFQEKLSKGSENSNQNLFEFSTVYVKKDDNVKEKKELSKQIKTIPEISDEKSSDSGRESVDSSGRVRRKLPSIEDVLGAKSEDADKREILSPDNRTISNSSDYELTKDNISHLSAAEIERRKIASNIQKAKSRFKSDDSEFDPSRFEFTSSFPNKSMEVNKAKTSSLDRNVKLHDYFETDMSSDSIKKDNNDKITAKGLDLAKSGETQTEHKQDKKVKERKYGGGGFDLGMSYSKKPEKLEKEKVETVEEEPVSFEPPKEVSSVKQKPEIKKYGGGGFDLGTSFSPKAIETKSDKAISNEEMKEKGRNSTELPKESQIKYGAEVNELGTMFTPKKTEEMSVKKDLISDRVSDPAHTPAKKKQIKEEKKYGGGGMDLGTSFVSKPPEKVTELVLKRRASDEVQSIQSTRLDLSDTKLSTPQSVQTKKAEAIEVFKSEIPDTQVSTFTMKPSVPDDKPANSENKDNTASKPPSSPRGDRRRLAEQRYGKVSQTSQPFEFSTVYVKKDSDAERKDNVNVQEISEVKSIVKQDVATDASRNLEKPSEIKPKAQIDKSQKQSIRPLSFTTLDSQDNSVKRRSSLEHRESVERRLSDTTEGFSNKSKFEKLDLKAQAVSTASGKIVEHPLSPRRQSPVRSEPIKMLTSETKLKEPPYVMPTIATTKEIKTLNSDIRAKENLSVVSDVKESKSSPLVISEKALEKTTPKDSKSLIRVERSESLKKDTVKMKEPDAKVGDNDLEKPSSKYVDLSNVELKSPVKAEHIEGTKAEPEVPLFLEQAGKVVHEDNIPERGRKTEKTRAGKPKVEKTVIAQVRNETILQDSTLDDILDRNVDYLSDMEPPDFSARGRGSQKKGRPQSIHEHHKTKRAFKKRAAMRRSKSEDRSHHKVSTDEGMQRSTVTDELKRSIEKIKASTDKVAASPKDVQSIVKKKDKQPGKSDEPATSSVTKPKSTAVVQPGKGSANQQTATTSYTGQGLADTAKSVIISTGSSTTKPETYRPVIGAINTGVTPQTAITSRTSKEVRPSVTVKKDVTPQTFITSSSHISTESSKSSPQQTVSTVPPSFIKQQTSSSLELKQTSDNVNVSKHSPSISAMLYGDAEDNLSSHIDSTSEQLSGVMSDASEVSDRLKVTASDLNRESETSRITTDSDQSVSSALSDGSRRRRKDKSSMRKSKLNEGQEFSNLKEAADDTKKFSNLKEAADDTKNVPTINRKRDTDDSRSSKSGVRRTSSSRLARETKEDKHKHNEEVLDVFKRHDLEVSKSWKGLNQTSNNSDHIHDKLLHDKDAQYLNNADRPSSKSLLDSHSVLPSKFSIPSKVSAAISKLTEASERSSRENSPISKKNNDLNSPRGIKRGTNFSQLLQKFSGSDASSSEKSDTDSQSPIGRKSLLRRQEATAHSSPSSDDSRRTPERTQSLRLKMSTSTSSDKDSTIQRSSSFKSDFMKRQYSPEPEGRRRLPNTPSDEQSDKPSPELAKVLNKRSQIVAKQQEEGEEVERRRIHDGKVEKADRFSSAGNDEVIADSEVLRMLQSRRKETDSSVDYSSVSETENKTQMKSEQTLQSQSVEDIKPSPGAIQSVKSMFEVKSDAPPPVFTHSVVQPPSAPSVGQSKPPQLVRPDLQTQSSYESKATLILSPTSKEIKDPFDSEQPLQSKSGNSVPKFDMTSIDTSLNILKSISDDKSNVHEQMSQAVTNVNTSSPREVVQFIKSVESSVKQPDNKPASASKIELQTDSIKTIYDKPIGEEKAYEAEYKVLQPTFEKEFRQPSSSTSTSGTIDITNKSEIIRKISTREKTPEKQSTRKTGPMKVLSPMPSSPSTGLTRTESVGRTDSERPKGILKRTPSLKHTGVSVDPELAEVLMSRRTKHDETEEEDERRKLTVEEEIRKARELQGEKHVDGETDRSVSVAERIFQMTNKIEEAKSCPITPRARSGFTTPKAVLLGSGSITPKSQFSFDEGNNKQQPLSGSQLIEKLSTLEDQQSQGVSQKRQKFQQRKRNDPRTRTQPVTLQEIQLADSLETVKKFRTDILKKASNDTFEVIQKEQQETDKAEFPLHFRKDKRPRGDRHKTLPVTAAELSAIPEGQVSETMNTLKKRFESQGARDSKADSGILSGGSDGEYLERDTDSWRSLSVEDNITEDDPVKMSVSAKASMFTQIQETLKEKPEKKSASGAKRYIDRKKRERSRTLPITEDEVKLAAEIADEENGKDDNTDKDVGTQEATESDSPDELSRQSLKDKVKLFTSIEEEKKEAVKKKGVPPPPKRRKGRLASRFATQPVTIEEVETAAKISPLACSLIKPPDPDILSGLSVKAQRELMVQHAQQTLSQPSSRAGSRASSRATSISDLTEDYQTVINTEVNESRSSVDAEESVRPSAFKGKTFTASKSFDESHSSHAVEKFKSDLDTQKKSVLKSELEQKLSLQLHHDSKGILKPNTNIVPTISDINKVLKKDTSVEKSSSEVKSILKKEGSFESRKMEVDTSLRKTDSFKSEVLSSEVREADELEQSDDMLESSGDNLDSDEGLLDSNIGPEELVDTPVRRREKKARRRFNRDRQKETERYKTQPTDTSTPETDASRLKKKYVGRHLTQPVTPDEKKEAEIVTDMPEITKSGSIQDRLSALKKSGEEEWRKRVSRPLEMDSIDRRSVSPEMTPPVVKMRERKQLDTPRPHSIADRLSLLDSAQANWRERVGETDVKKFTVEHKISSSGQSIGESPLVARLKGKTPRREHSRESESSDTDLTSPSTPTKDSNKIPLPREVICTDIPVELLKEDSKSTQSSLKSVEEEKKPPSNIEVPNIDAELDTFFKTKENLPAKTPELDVTVDDFNELFMNANDMLESVQKVKPKRRHAAKSRNPLKTMSASLEVRSEYTEVITGVADRELKRVKTAQISQNSGFAVEALAGLASKENFSKVELRKTESFGASRLEPYLPLMLIHIKGRRKVQCRLVEPKAESINSGDCYALITADKIIQWHGEFCNVIEKAKAADFCDFVKQKRDLGCKKARDVMIVEEKQRGPGTRHFWELLGGQKPYMASGSTEEDELYENHITETNMIYKLEHNKLVAVDECWGAQPKYEMLNPYQVYVFDFGSEVYVWQGKSVSPAQRKISVKLAQQVWDRGYDYSQCDINPISPLRGEEEGGITSKSEKRPDWALFGKVNQNMETILFREKFSDWPDTSRLIKVKSQEEANSTKVDLADLKAYDAKLMVPLDTSPVSLVLEGSHVGRGNSWAQDMDGFIQEQVIETLKIRIWHVLEYDHYEIEDHSYGQFHEGDTYVIRWQYMIMNAGMKNLKGQLSRHSTRGRERCAYFFWQGKTSTVNEKGASALMTVELDEERGPQVRVSEGKEMPCFLNLFKGRMIIHIGKREEEETNTEGPWKMYCLRNEYENEMCLIEVNLEISNLRSVSSCLLLNIETGQILVWHGCKSPEHTQKLARKAADNLKERCPLEVGLKKGVSIDISEVQEGKETTQFWRLMDVQLGDRSEYHSLLNNPKSFNYTLRLFHMTSVSGVFEVNEILNPSRTPDLPTRFPVLQSDLYNLSVQPGLFLIDSGHEVFLWQGWWPEGDEEQVNVITGSAQTRFTVDRRCAMETTIQYCKEISPDNPRPAYMVYAGLEPLSFTHLFPFWIIEESVREINIRDGRVEGQLVPVADLYKKLTKTRYTFAELTDTTLPEGVDPMKLETYLSDTEFEEVLHITREEYDSLPNWKKTKFKQEAGLF